MKVICDRGALADALNLVSGVVASRTPKPVLMCVKLDAQDGEGGLTVMGTDMEASVRLVTQRVEVQTPGAAVLPADKLQSIVRESADATLTIETEQDQAIITGQDSRFRIFGHPVGDFPDLEQDIDNPDFEISANDLHRLVAMTIFATARENSRYAINGVLLERESGKLSVVATDGHRLAMAKGTCRAGSDKTESAIVPSKALNLLLRLFDDADEVVKVKIANRRIHFATDNSVLSSVLVDGNFPPYKDVIPKDGDRKATVNTDLFISGVRRAALLTNEESKGVRMAFGPEGLKLSSRAPEMGEAEINVELPEYSGEPIEIGFNPAYLLDALKVIDEAQVQFEFKAPSKPGVLRTGPNFLYVVMPVNLQ